MKKILPLVVVCIVCLFIFIDIFVIHNRNTLVTFVMLAILLLMSWRIKALQRMFFVFALIFLIISVVLYYFFQYPYFRESADWVFYFLVLGIFLLFVER